MPEKTQRPDSPPQKENLMITNPQAEIKEERVKPRPGNCKRRILDRMILMMKLGTSMKMSQKQKKVKMHSFVTCFGL